MNEIQKYFKKRQALIDQYVKGDFTKLEYLEENLNLALSQKFSSFKNADTPEKALFNYQYYNALAKAYNSRSATKKMTPEKKVEITAKVSYYYSKKDAATMKLLVLLDYQGVYSYYVKVRSRHLKQKLIEIVLEDFNMILHTVNPVILNQLRHENVFLEETRKSLIDGYINQKY